jgi:hypothetical protein
VSDAAYCFIFTPSSVDPRRESGFAYAVPPGFVVEVREANASLVSRLLDARRPSTVRGFVSSVVVDAVDAVLRRRLAAHVFEERGE